MFWGCFGGLNPFSGGTKGPLGQFFFLARLFLHVDLFGNVVPLGTFLPQLHSSLQGFPESVELLGRMQLNNMFFCCCVCLFCFWCVFLGCFVCLMLLFVLFLVCFFGVFCLFNVIVCFVFGVFFWGVLFV